MKRWIAFLKTTSVWKSRRSPSEEVNNFIMFMGIKQI